MFELFKMGGPLFMTFITIFAVIALLFLVQSVMQMNRARQVPSRKLRNMLIAGGTAFATGLLAQVIGLYQAMSAIERAGDVSPSIVAGGFKVSIIAPAYGLTVFLIILAAYLLIQFFQREEADGQGFGS